MALVSCGGKANGTHRAADTAIESAGDAGAGNAGTGNAGADNAGAGNAGTGSGGAEASCGNGTPLVETACTEEGLRCGPYLEYLECPDGRVPFDSFRVCTQRRWTREDEQHSGCYL